jgi:RP/EB family microtubule-associated protein
MSLFVELIFAKHSCKQSTSFQYFCLKMDVGVVNVFVSAVTPENISRHELLAWVNATLQSNLTKIEQMSTGAAYCALTDVLFPGKVPLKKVKWNTRQEVDWVNNWRVLQTVWKTIGVDKPVPVQNLLKAKFQDNFEFLQWFKKFFDANYSGVEYNALEARNFEEFPAALPGGGARAPPRVSNVHRPATTAAPSAARTSAAKPPVVRNTVKTTAAAPPTRASTAAGTRPSAVRRSVAPVSNGNANTLDAAAANATIMQLENKHKQELEELQTQLVAFHESIETLERERDFYFAKLRQIEIICQEAENDNDEAAMIAVAPVKAVLYEKDDEGEADANPNGHDEHKNGNVLTEEKGNIKEDTVVAVENHPANITHPANETDNELHAQEEHLHTEDLLNTTETRETPLLDFSDVPSVNVVQEQAKAHMPHSGGDADVLNSLHEESTTLENVATPAKILSVDETF